MGAFAHPIRAQRMLSKKQLAKCPCWKVKEVCSLMVSGPRSHRAATRSIIRPAGRLALRAARVPMNRRRFLLNTSIVGAGLLGARNSAPGLLRADAVKNSDSNLTLEEKPVAFSVPPLLYSFDALEPYIDAKTMEIHHDKHHGAYVTNLNKAIDGQAALQAKPI